jgi:chromosome segregation ATPase
MNKPKKAKLMAEIGSFKAENIALNERLNRYQAVLAAAREHISSMEERISSMEERFELIAVLAAPREAECRVVSAADTGWRGTNPTP